MFHNDWFRHSEVLGSGINRHIDSMEIALIQNKESRITNPSVENVVILVYSLSPNLIGLLYLNCSTKKAHNTFGYCNVYS
jgi:hypothetical protein